MYRNLILTLVTALAVFAFGAGATGVAPTAASSSAIAPLMSGTHILPVVTVIAHVPLAGNRAETRDSVMLGAAMQRAGAALAGQVGVGVRRVGLAVPYYAFGRSAARPVE